MRTKTKKKTRRARTITKRCPQARIFLDEAAFIALVAAATEAYRRECYGILLGNHRRGRVYIRVAFAYQTARRMPKSVEMMIGRRNALHRILRRFPKYDYIGEFHSHPGYGDESGQAVLGELDMIGVRPGDCELIMAVRRPRAARPWRHCADGSVTGVAGKYWIQMRTYLAEPTNNGHVRARRVRLKCPYAVGVASSPRLLARHEQNSITRKSSTTMFRNRPRTRT